MNNEYRSEYHASSSQVSVTVALATAECCLPRLVCWVTTVELETHAYQMITSKLKSSRFLRGKITISANQHLYTAPLRQRKPVCVDREVDRKADASWKRNLGTVGDTGLHCHQAILLGLSVRFAQ